ncbi:SMP-30/gluconolactonase/LRE family protein [Dactylosporangium aurantiacum]|uniref:SMP-30/gluconolactonase/LRE family protein n=1 Tax=Dactylosporangium aurantiacum TaxID=35754 RepID=A0A9Q9I7H6_9ACTN|nr:SMP-30/gluconolactonase/LRE family protein [Dactylosporangium aurantiacum]MDG6106903.1 SMP-30/gluconolactonase/LRE family protein [Dactylosporangium aurantiacum]UWZ50732.1 SMP-30/gluconolactonase/LRE family protein [Dactylosporangium aurantiacum]
MRAEPITDPVTYHGEGPVWSASWGGLRWVDMLAGDILSLAADATVTRRHVGTVAAVVRPRTRGGAVIGVERGFALEDPDGMITHLPPVWADGGIRMNEGGCDPDGRFYCGSMAYDQRPGAASLYRLDPDGSVRVVLDGVTISNGLEWSPDGSRAYYNDTPTGQVTVFDYDPATGLTGRRAFVTVPDHLGHPDGLTVDVEGGVWVALHGGGAVHRYTPGGALDEVVELPTAQVTACAFGGERLDELFVTTSREGMEPGDDPVAGTLFRAAAGIQGLPVRAFAG